MYPKLKSAAAGLHTILFAAYPVLALLAHNIDELPSTDSTRALVSAVSLAILLLSLSWFWLKHTARAALIATGFLVLFFSYGHVFDVLTERTIAGVLIGRHRVLLPLWGIIAIGWVTLVVRRFKVPIEITRFFNIVGITLVLLPTVTILSKEIETRRLDNNPVYLDLHSQNDSRFATPGVRPDIFYIILDGYARQDILLELYGYDNTEFIQFLKERGFYVAEQSHSNYNQTTHSLASSLNMEYIQNFENLPSVSPGEKPVFPFLIKHSQVRYILESRGYKLVTFNSGYENTTLPLADVYFDLEEQAESTLGLNAFEGLLLESTLLLPALDWWSITHPLEQETLTPDEYQKHRNRIINTLSALGDKVARLDGSYFVFAHILAPHPPFVFDAQGNIITPDEVYSLRDGSDFRGSREAYIQGYRDQLIFINRLVMEAIDTILTQSDLPPVIILQSDHGPGAYLEWESLSQSNLAERLANLNAYHIPGGDRGLLYPSITPVNTFRVVFNQLFQANYEFLPDEIYFSTHAEPRKFIRVTEWVDPIR